jgi:hypothetical protein
MAPDCVPETIRARLDSVANGSAMRNMILVADES